MNLAKRTYVLPVETLTEFEELVPPRQRSATLQRLIREWLDEQRRAKLRAEIIEGLEEMSEIYLQTAREWESLEEEVARGYAD